MILAFPLHRLSEQRRSPLTNGHLSASELAGLNEGRPEIVERVLVELMSSMNGWLFRLLGQSSFVEDALQEALIELTKSFANFRGDASLRTFAHRITTRVAYRYFKKVSADRERMSETVEPACGRKLEAQLIARSDLALVYQILDSLSENRRVAFILCEVEGLSPREAADVEGVSSLVMRSRLSRAKADVRQKLAQSSQQIAAPMEENS